MFNFQQNIFLTNSFFNPFTELEVGQGDCITSPTVWDTVYVSGTNVISVSNGDIFYTDINLTMPYNGGGNTFRVRIPGGGISPLIDIEFTISSIGVVSNVISCTGSTGGIFLDGVEENTTCYSAQCFTVVLGTASSKIVTISKTGLASYGSFDSCLSTAGQIITSNFSETITSNKTYKLSIEADSGAGTASTTISINAVGGGDDDTLFLIRNHSDIPQKC